MSDELEALIVVKSYPNPSQNLGEATCIVGICEQRGFVRIYPVPFRKLDDEQQFRKYQRVRMRVQPPKSDTRPDTFRMVLDSFEVLGDPLATGKDKKWSARKELVLPLASESMCSIIARQNQDRTSMGLFKPAEVLDLTQEEQSEEWNATELAKLQ